MALSHTAQGDQRGRARDHAGVVSTAVPRIENKAETKCSGTLAEGGVTAERGKQVTHVGTYGNHSEGRWLTARAAGHTRGPGGRELTVWTRGGLQERT